MKNHTIESLSNVIYSQIKNWEGEVASLENKITKMKEAANALRQVSGQSRLSLRSIKNTILSRASTKRSHSPSELLKGLEGNNYGSLHQLKIKGILRHNGLMGRSSRYTLA